MSDVQPKAKPTRVRKPRTPIVPTPTEEEEEVDSFVTVVEFQTGLGTAQTAAGQQETICFLQICGFDNQGQPAVHAFSLGPLTALRLGLETSRAGLALTEMIGQMVAQKSAQAAAAPIGHGGYL